MKTLLKLLAGLLGLVVVLAGAGLVYVFTRYPAVPLPEEGRIQATPERLARGEYLVENVVGCVVCHADRDWTKFSAPVIAGTKGKGGQRFGFGAEPFVLYAKNITPGGVGEWTDGELLRAITAGVSRDGTPLFPLMPYPRYGRIYAYLRSLPPVVNRVEKFPAAASSR